jgi:hypothetical protein
MISSEKAMRIRGRILIGAGVLVMLFVAGCSRVADDWRAAQAADTSEAYQQFLQQHADSEFGTQAQERIKQLAENRDWQGASSADTRDAYQQFLAQHPDSKWAQEARVRIENFQLASGNSGSASTDAGSGPAPAGDTEVSAPPVPKPAAAAKSTGARPAASPAKPASIGAGSVYAQLGAYSSRARAEAEWQKLRGSVAELAALKPHYSVGKSGADNVYRLQVGVQSRQQALNLCASLKKRSLACIPAGG